MEIPRALGGIPDNADTEWNGLGVRRSGGGRGSDGGGGNGVGRRTAGGLLSSPGGPGDGEAEWCVGVIGSGATTGLGDEAGDGLRRRMDSLRPKMRCKALPSRSARTQRRTEAVDVAGCSTTCNST
eukprot:349546-Pleurochrysis_carterae.AAC.1